MADTYTWQISTLDRETSDGFVFTSHWRLNASRTVADKDYTAGIYGTAGFSVKPDAKDFVPYEDITEAQAMTWTKASINDPDDTAVATLEARVSKQLDDQVNPPTATGVPWSAAE